MPLFIFSLLGISLGLLLLQHSFIPFFIILGVSFLFCCVQTFPTIALSLSGLFQQLRWWHFCWILLFFSGLVFRVRETNVAVESPLDLWGLYRISLVALVGFILLYRLVTAQPDWLPLLFRGLTGLLFGYAVVNLFSALWSVYPMWTFYKSTEYLVDITLITAIVSSLVKPSEFLSLYNLTWFLIGVRVLLIWLGIIIVPDQAINRGVGLIGIQISGVLPATSSNGVGGLSAVLATVSFCRFFIGRKKVQFYLVVFLISVCTLILSQTRSALVGFLCAIFIVLFASKKIGVMSLILGGCAGIFLLSSGGEIFIDFFMRGQTSGLFSSLSGRTVWWEIGWRLFIEQPLIGYGGYAGARFKALSEAGRTITSSIHNTWLEILLGVGIIGFTFFSMCFVKTWTGLFRIVHKENEQTVPYLLAIEALGTMTVLSVRSVFASSLIWHPSLSFLLVLGFVETYRRFGSNIRA